MMKIALTGGIGTGKSFVAMDFIAMGVPVFCADDEAKKLYDDDSFLKSFKKEFPDKDLWNDNKLNNEFLKKSFYDEEFLRKLSLFVQPYVMKKFDEWCNQQTSDSVIMESAIIYEYDLEKHFDLVIVVDAPLDLRIKRLKIRNPELSYEDIRTRISRQMSQETKCAKADLVIYTGDTYKEMKCLNI